MTPSKPRKCFHCPCTAENWILTCCKCSEKFPSLYKESNFAPVVHFEFREIPE